MPNSDDRRLVYSTDGSMPLPDLHGERRAPKATKAQTPPDDGVVRVGCERRRGGSVTLVYGLTPSELTSIAAELKRRCGTGGTVKSGLIELQGDRRDAVLAYFEAAKRRTKRMGG